MRVNAATCHQLGICSLNRPSCSTTRSSHSMTARCKSATVLHYKPSTPIPRWKTLGGTISPVPATPRSRRSALPEGCVAPASQPYPSCLSWRMKPKRHWLVQHARSPCPTQLTSGRQSLCSARSICRSASRKLSRVWTWCLAPRIGPSSLHVRPEADPVQPPNRAISGCSRRFRWRLPWLPPELTCSATKSNDHCGVTWLWRGGPLSKTWAEADVTALAVVRTTCASVQELCWEKLTLAVETTSCADSTNKPVESTPPVSIKIPTVARR